MSGPRGLARVPLIAADTARALMTPLPVVLGWTLDELYFWHGVACDVMDP